jgi:hypothetical protein
LFIVLSLKILNTKRPQYSYNGKISNFLYDATYHAYFTEKQLREAAAAEVAKQSSCSYDELDKGSRKRKNMNADEKARQK